MAAFRTVRGMRDFLPEDAEKMGHVQRIAEDLAQLYGYEKVITPVVEYYDLLAAKAGEENRKRMYAFKDLGGRRVALRPEFTPSVARLVTTKMMQKAKPIRLFCMGSLYRYDEPQYGRYREFWSSNYELIGSNRPEADAEILTLTYDLMEQLGLRNYHFKISHMGILRGILSQEGVEEGQQNQMMPLLDQMMWDEALTLAQTLNVSQRCISILKNIFETKGKNVSKVLERVRDLVQNYKNAAASVENLREILELTREGGAKFEISVEARFARGLEYYTGIIFEVYVPGIEVALGGGGRYDKLIELFGGESTPAVGVGHGIDRLMLAMGQQKVFPKGEGEKRVMIIPVGEEVRARAIGVSLMLRGEGIPAEVEVMGRTVSRALSHADRMGVTHAVILGPEELKEGKVVLRDMKKREQRAIEMGNLSKEILTRAPIKSNAATRD